MHNDSTTELTVLSPNDGAVLETFALSDWKMVERWLTEATALLADSKRHLPVPERLSILEKTGALLSERAEEFSMRVATEGGKPLKDARAEVARAIEGIAIARGELRHALQEESVAMELNKASANRVAFSVKEPIGVIAAISAFNHPLNLIIHQVIPAVAVGAPILIKPDSRTPLSCFALCDLLKEAGLPEGWVRPLLCTNETAEKLVTDKRIGFFNFIGSAKVGWMLAHKLAPGTRFALEHGGAAPVIVHADADVEAIIPPLLKGGYYHAGQVCVSVQRVYVPEKMAADFAERLAAGAAKLVTGDAREEKTDVGPMILPREADRVEQWIAEAIKEGAKKIGDGKRLNERYHTPTVLLNPSPASKVTTEEVFGPLVCVYGYKDVEEAIQRANDSRYAFQASVFGRDGAQNLATAKRLDAAAVMINDHTAFRVDWMPFGGRRESGFGMGGIGYTMRDYLQPKLLVIKHS